MRGRRHLLLLLPVAACVPKLPQREARHAPTALAQRDPAALRAAMLEQHARARRSVGVAPLRWDEGLAREALDYARAMAVTRQFRHSEQPEGRGREGENLWTGTRDAFTYDEMFGPWAAERGRFVNAAAPDFSRTGRWQDVSHYTQIVWRGTKQVGCALASNRDQDFLVCRYLPPGNVVGERAF